MKLILENIDITSFIKAFNEFKRALFYAQTSDADFPKKLQEAAAIQCFEFTYELAWKTMKRLLNERGVEVNSPKTTFRAAAKEGWIDDPETWFVFQKARNMTSHTYDNDVASVYSNNYRIFKLRLRNL